MHVNSLRARTTSVCSQECTHLCTAESETAWTSPSTYSDPSQPDLARMYCTCTRRLARMAGNTYIQWCVYVHACICTHALRLHACMQARRVHVLCLMDAHIRTIMRTQGCSPTRAFEISSTSIMPELAGYLYTPLKAGTLQHM